MACTDNIGKDIGRSVIAVCVIDSGTWTTAFRDNREFEVRLSRAPADTQHNATVPTDIVPASRKLKDIWQRLALSLQSRNRSGPPAPLVDTSSRRATVITLHLRSKYQQGPNIKWDRHRTVRFNDLPADGYLQVSPIAAVGRCECDQLIKGLPHLITLTGTPEAMTKFLAAP